MSVNPVLKTEPDIVMRAIIKTTIRVQRRRVHSHVSWPHLYNTPTVYSRHTHIICVGVSRLKQGL